MATQTLPNTGTAGGQATQLASLLTGLGATAKLHLFKSSFVPTANNVKADFTAAEATFTGYAAVILAFSAVAVGADGNPVAVSNRVFFLATDAVNPNTIGGWWIEDSAGPPTNLIYFGKFPAPIPMNAALAFLACTLLLQVSGGNVVAEN